jgi:hypothetical protein
LWERGSKYRLDLPKFSGTFGAPRRWPSGENGLGWKGVRMASRTDPFEINPRERARRYLELAGEARAMAADVNDPAVCAAYLRAVEHWVAFAAEAEQAMRKDEAAPDSLSGHDVPAPFGT